MIDKDKRCIKVDNLIIITNYKCMFSSLSKLEGEKVSNLDLLQNEVIFVYREPKLRLISCFLHWGIRSPLKNKKDQQGNIGGWLLKEFKNNELFDFDYYNNNLKSELTNEILIELFKRFLDILQNIYENNKHLHQQIKIIKDYKIDVSTFINSDNQEQVKLLENKLDKTFRVCNKSNNMQKQLLLDFLSINNDYSNIINDIYEDDIELISSINSV